MQTLRRITFILLLSAGVGQAETVQIVTWNLEWFPGKKPTSTPAVRALHMSEGKDALFVINPDIFCAQEIRDWENFAELTSVLPNLKPLTVSKFRDTPKGGAISIQQTAIASTYEADSAWFEEFTAATNTPPRGFSFAAIHIGKTTVLLYSVHLKSNMGGIPLAIPKREEGAKQLIAHAMNMEKLYGKRGMTATIIAGDFNTDPTDPQFAQDKTFDEFKRAGFKWVWETTPREKRVTHKGNNKYPDATFDGFLTKGTQVVSAEALPATQASDHNPVLLKIEIP